MRRTADWSLYLVTDRSLSLGRSLEEVVAQAVAGGASAVQLREKEADTRTFVELACRLKTVLKPYGVPLIVNDRVDVALAADAEGVHLGQRDMSVADARRLLGPGRILGLSVESLDQAHEAEALDVDYLGASPIFPTPTKTDTRGAWRLEGLRDLRAATRHPLVAIGGLNLGNVAEVMAAGADGIAVVSALCSALDPAAAAQALRSAIDAGRALRHRPAFPRSTANAPHAPATRENRI